MNRIITQLRDIIPIRPLTWIEAMHTAERQALRLLELAEVKSPPVPEEIVSRLPRLQVERMVPSPASGASQWSHGRWLIVLNGAHPMGRQRFTLAHEFKHILDNPFIKVLYPPTGAVSSYERAEAVCDFFAACLLMPRPWLKAAWRTGPQDLRSLAGNFEVSRQAMDVRLQQIGLQEPAPRCARPAQVA